MSTTRWPRPTSSSAIAANSTKSAAWLPENAALVAAFDALLRGDAAPADAEPLTRESVATCFVRAAQSLARAADDPADRRPALRAGGGAGAVRLAGDGGAGAPDPAGGDDAHRRRVWGTTDQPSSDTLLLQEIIGRYSPLTPDSLSGPGQSGLVGINQDGTDIRFLQARAEANGYELIFRRGAVYFGPMRPDLPTPQPSLLMYAGRESSGISFTASGDAHQPDAVALDVPSGAGEGSRESRIEPNLPVMGRTHAGSADRGLSPFVWRLSGQAGAEPDTRRLESQAQQRANDADLRPVQAEGELDGTLYGHVLLPGLPVSVDGVGTRLSGVYYVDSVTHSFNAQGYRQRFRLLRNAFGDTL